MHGTPIYRTWAHIKQRCLNPTYKSFSNYGRRGITVCDEWCHYFQAFFDHVSRLAHFGEDGYTLDRIDNGGNYAPGCFAHRGCDSGAMAMEAELVKGRVKNKTPVEYAPYVEFGHRVKIHGKFTGTVVPGRFMLRDGVQESADNFVADAEKTLARIFS